MGTPPFQKIFVQNVSLRADLLRRRTDGKGKRFTFSPFHPSSSASKVCTQANKMCYNLFLGEGLVRCQIKHFCLEMNGSNEYYAWQPSTLNFAKRALPASSHSFKGVIMQNISGNMPQARHFPIVGSAIDSALYSRGLKFKTLKVQDCIQVLTGLVSSRCLSI